MGEPAGNPDGDDVRQPTRTTAIKANPTPARVVLLILKHSGANQGDFRGPPSKPPPRPRTGGKRQDRLYENSTRSLSDTAVFALVAPWLLAEFRLRISGCSAGAVWLKWKVRNILAKRSS